jgi:hypothetical protein
MSKNLDSVIKKVENGEIAEITDLILGGGDSSAIALG